MKLFESWRFRTSKPEFQEGDRLELYTSGFDHERQQLWANIGDTVLYINDPNPNYRDCKVTVNVTSFDSKNHRGEAELISVDSTAEF